MNNGRKFKYGFEFPYTNGKIGTSRRLTEADMRRIPKSKRNVTQPMYVRCEACGVYMAFIDGLTGDVDGIWKCSKCGSVVEERAAFVQLNLEIEMLDEILTELGGLENMDE